jgi:uncharacterized membrane protein YphA (DoxX/SURF4 family)
MNRWGKGFLIALRIAVGWHFLYEGLWKFDSDTGATAYATSWYPLQSSIERMRDPDAWYDEIVKTFKGRNQALTEEQKGRLAVLRDKVKVSGKVDFDWIYVKDTVLQLAEPPEGERFTALPFLQQSAGPMRPVFRGLVRDIDGLDRLTLASAHAALDVRAEEIAKHYSFTAEQRAKLGQARDKIKSAFAAAWNQPDIQTRLADYKMMRRRVGNIPESGAPYHHERLSQDRQKLDLIAGELLALVNEPGDELAVQALGIVSVAQMAAGPVPRPATPVDWIDRAMKWGLVAIGACLMLGLFTRYAAIAAAVQLLVFYLASPPWPGLPGATMGGHYLYIDRNFIELIAAGAIAATTGGRHESQRTATEDRTGQLLRRPETDAA